MTKKAGRTSLVFLLGLLAWLLPGASGAATQHHAFTVTVVNKNGGAPIPGLKLTTTNQIALVTDAAGKVRLYEPGLMGQSVFFQLGQCVLGKCQNGSGAVTSCSTNANCNLGFDPPLAFLGLPGGALTATEQGNVTLRLCPSGACTSDALVAASASSPTPLSTEMFKLTVVDAATGRGVPQMHVVTSAQTYVTDSAGRIAFYDPGKMGTTIHFAASGDGYAKAEVDLLAVAGGSGQVAVPRVDLAERLYRLTGGGAYYATALLELPAPTAKPLLNASVFGQDTAQTTVYKGHVVWIWGDTLRPEYPLGNFRVTGAVSQLPAAGGLDPSVGVDFTYIGDGSGFVAPLCPTASFPPPVAGQGLLCWMFDLVTAPDASGNERLFSRYTLVPNGAGTGETGLGRFNDATSAFDKLVTWPSTQKVNLVGQPMKIVHGQSLYAYYVERAVSSFGSGLKPIDSLSRVAANEASLANPASYESYTPLVQGSDTVLDTQPDGTLRYAWKTGTKPLSGDNAVADAAAAADQKLYGHLMDPDSQVVPVISTESVTYNAYRQRYVAIALQSFASESFLGELWYAEADTPMGPWVYGRRIVTHATDGYTFYNPRHHGFFDKQGGKEIYFEATYTATYASNVVPTARDDYNQVMERLDLDTPGVVLPVPIYDLSKASVPGTFVTKRELLPTTKDSVATFLAPDRAGFSGTVPVSWSDAECRPRQLVVGGAATMPAVFHALPPTVANPPAPTIPLFHYVDAAAGRHAYSVEPAAVLPGFVRAADPIARVWANPIRVNLPVSQYLATLRTDAGADQCPTESAIGAGASVVLDGSRTLAPAGAVTYEWTYPGGSATGVTANVILPVGLHVVSLKATAADGQTSRDTALVHVAPCTSPSCAAAADGGADGAADGGASSADGGESVPPDAGATPDRGRSAGGCGCTMVDPAPLSSPGVLLLLLLARMSARRSRK
jgi:hypothetical protein